MAISDYDPYNLYIGSRDNSKDVKERANKIRKLFMASWEKRASINRD